MEGRSKVQTQWGAGLDVVSDNESKKEEGLTWKLQ